MNPPISITSEVERMRAHARAPGVAQRCELREFYAEERQLLVFTRLQAIAVRCAEINRQLAALEDEVMGLEDVLA